VDTAPRRQLTLEEIRALAPDVIIASSRASQAALFADPEWRDIPAVANGRVHVPPGLPFNWGPRPPSVNRLPGMIWMSYVLRPKAFDDEFDADLGAFFEAFYHLDLDARQLRALINE
jgi:iron complex transport system substrate-binding protein